jgi:hypothetical protein
MKALGYPRLISLENFRTPNFELVADCLTWLVHRYKPRMRHSSVPQALHVTDLQQQTLAAAGSSSNSTQQAWSMSPNTQPGAVTYILVLVSRFHPGASLPEDIATEAQRVKLLTTTAELLLTKARMRLNIKRLYAADGSAVAELLKLAELLHKATRAAGSESNVSERGGAVACSSNSRLLCLHTLAMSHGR